MNKHYTPQQAEEALRQLYFQIVATEDKVELRKLDEAAWEWVLLRLNEDLSSIAFDLSQLANFKTETDDDFSTYMAKEYTQEYADWAAGRAPNPWIGRDSELD